MQPPADGTFLSGAGVLPIHTIDGARLSGGRTYRVGIVGLGPVAIRRRASEDLPRVVQESARASVRPPFVPFGDPVIHSHVWAIGHVPQLSIEAVCDIDQARIDRFEDNWGARWPDARSYRDYRDMLACKDLDIVAVTTPEHLHSEPTVAAAEAGVRAVFCEKP